eukprot:365997-Chlamydomonas_euryale.AAC.2
MFARPHMRSDDAHSMQSPHDLRQRPPAPVMPSASHAPGPCFSSCLQSVASSAHLIACTGMGLGGDAQVPCTPAIPLSARRGQQQAKQVKQQAKQVEQQAKQVEQQAKQVEQKAMQSQQ